jgi:hypothetical protein
MFNWTLFLVGLFMSFVIQAKSIIPIQNNTRVTVTISNHGYTRFSVLFDRISSVRGIAGAYQLQKDEQAGEFYVMPTRDYHTVLPV